MHPPACRTNKYLEVSPCAPHVAALYLALCRASRSRSPPPMRAGTGSHDAVKTGGQQVRPVHPSGTFRPPSGSSRIHTSGSDQSQTWSVKRYTARLSRFYKPAKITERARAVVGRFRSILYGGCRDDVEETVKGWRGSERKLDANARQPPSAHHAQTSLWVPFFFSFFFSVCVFLVMAFI
ncbi:hypothetical protein B0T13DRAFT_42105 [Neurospora crassa]|nr:hypothetical protein B0T13DRAFT_42105 [Neurospora crassa]